MKPLLLFACMFAVGVVFAEGRVYDLTIENQAVLTCASPTEYDDGTPLPQTSITEYKLYKSQIIDGTYTEASISSTCRFIEPLSQTGQYYYYATVVDSRGIESLPSNIVPLEVRQLGRPNPPTGLSLQ